MTDIAILIIFWSILFMVAFVYIPLWRKHHDAGTGLYARTQDDNKLSINYALKKLGCKVKWEKDYEDLVARYDYQGARFRIRLQKSTPYVSLDYPFFFEAGLEQIEVLRRACNSCNLHTETCRFVYSVDAERGKIDIHIFNMLLLTDNTVSDVLQRAMDNIFRWQRTFVGLYGSLREQNERQHTADLEKDEAAQARELYLIREEEMSHQDGYTEWHEDKLRPMSIGHLLSATLSLTDMVPVSLELTRDGEVTSWDSEEQILDLDVASALITDGVFAHRSAVGRLCYYDPRQPVKMRRVVLSFDEEGETRDTLYYRVTLTLVPLSHDRGSAPDGTAHQTLMTSVLIGYDLQPRSKRHEEFKYLWKEAMGKLESGQVQDMSSEELMIIRLRHFDLAELVMRGKALFLQRRYYESVGLLEDAFRRMQDAFDSLSRSERSTLMDICHLAGTCYTHLHQYQRAAYYLHLTLPARQLNYTRSFVNCLVNSNDFRAMDFIDACMNDVRSIIGDKRPEEVSDDMQELVAFAGFLKRRKVFLLVRQRRYDEAEHLLKQLLDDADNSDFALKELAYIQKMRAK